MYFSLSLYLYLSLPLSLSFFGQVMFPHHSDQMSQRSQGSHVSRVTLCFFIRTHTRTLVGIELSQTKSGQLKR